MLKSCIEQIGLEVQQLQSRISVVREGWSDSVSAHVEHTYIDELAKMCKIFYSEAYNTEMNIRQREEMLRMLADKY